EAHVSYDDQVGLLPINGTPGFGAFLHDSATCPGSMFGCTPAPEDIPFGGALTLAPGQTLSWDMIILENWSVVEVPEPSSLMLFASVLGFGFYGLRRSPAQQ